MADLTKKYSGVNDDNRCAAIYGLVASLIAVAVIGVVTVALCQGSAPRSRERGGKSLK
jgi:hypothetical protein